MAKARTRYVCRECGQSSPRWLGRCSGCGAWNSLDEEKVAPAAGKGRAPGAARAPAEAVPLGEVRSEDALRLPTGLAELDRALGGGPVAGGVVLLGGDPGIGKSTLLMQALAGLAAAGHGAVYVSGEESAAQVALRAERIGGEPMRSVRVLASTELEDVEKAVESHGPRAVVIDSIQTLRTGELGSAPGTVSQLREVTGRLVELAKVRGTALFLIGHVTKEGAIAGPKVLEHLVDTVLSFEGDASHAFRLVRAAKNRFGPAHEVGVFEMVREGLREVPDPSALLLAERPADAAGSVVVPTAEGSRPLMVEVQALVSPAIYGASRRVTSGLDANRIGILLAVLERKAGVHLHDRDVFASIAGGVRVDERAVDLGLALAIASSHADAPVPAGMAAVGEVGLAGEVRAVPRLAARVAEARKMGFARLVVPRASVERLTAEEREGVELHGVARLDEALEAALPR